MSGLIHDVSSYGPTLLRGMELTLELTGVSLVISTVFGLVLAEMRMSPILPIRWAGRFVIDVIRGTPLLLQLFFLYFGLPQMGVTLSAFVVGACAIGGNYGAYMAEAFRGGIESVSTGQHQACTALGLTRMQAALHVIFPQAGRVIYPTYVGYVLSMIKDTSLVAVITLEELTYSAQILVNQTFKALAIFGMAAALYLAASYVVSFIAGILERRLQVPGTAGYTKDDRVGWFERFASRGARDMHNPVAGSAPGGGV